MATSNSTPKTIEVPLTRGYIAIIDECDSDLTLLNWRVHITKDKKEYAARSLKRTEDGKRPSESLHRIILARILGRELLKRELVDHKDGNGLNNRRENLRLSDKYTNQQNAGKKMTNTSGYKGVFRQKGKWTSRIRVFGQRIKLGAFDTPEEAYEAYCKAADKYHGEFARLE